MGLGGQAVDAIAREHAYRPIKGDVLLIGRQTTYFSPEELVARLKEHGHSPDPSAIEIDTSTIDRLEGYGNRKLVTDRSIFRALGIDSVKALDISPYEGAEVIHDLNFPLPDHLKESADFVVDGSTLDNTFDPAQTLRSFAQLLRPGGRLVAVNAFNTIETAYVIMSPSWYMDYFVDNGFIDCKVYVGIFVNGGGNVFWLDADQLQRSPRDSTRFLSSHAVFTLVFAEKGPASGTDRRPIQEHYRPSDRSAAFLENLSQVRKSARPHLARSLSDDLLVNEVSPGYTWIDRGFLPCLRPHGLLTLPGVKAEIRRNPRVRHVLSPVIRIVKRVMGGAR